MWSEGEEQMVLGFGDLDLLREQSALQPRCNLDLEISSLNLLALQEGLGFVFNVPHVFQTLLFNRYPIPLIKIAQHFPSVAVPLPGKEEQTPVRLSLSLVVCTIVPVSHYLGLL